MNKPKRKKRIISKILISLMLLCFALMVTGGVIAKEFYGDIRESVTIEAGEAIPGKADFLVDDWSWISMETDMSNVDTLIPGVMEVTFSLGPLKKNSVFTIKDSEAPVGEIQDLISEKGRELKPEDFIVSTEDTTDVSLKFVKAPNIEAEGIQPIEIALEDRSGNRTLLSAKLTLYDPMKGPEINGADDISIYEGDNISYRNGVSVTDELDPEVVLTIDNKAVNPDKVGSYPVSYRAEDRFGRVAVKKITVHVLEPPEDYQDQKKLKAMVDDWIGTYISDDMDDIHKSFAIFRWIRLNVPWDNTRTTRNEIEQALKGMQGLPGDCYTHAITCKTLMDAAGVKNIMVHRDPGPGQHYWLLVQIDGLWYHLDPSPIYTNLHICFLQTDLQVESFSKSFRRNYYAFNRADYPATPATNIAKVTYKRGDYYLEVY